MRNWAAYLVLCLPLIGCAVDAGSAPAIEVPDGTTARPGYADLVLYIPSPSDSVHTVEAEVTRASDDSVMAQSSVQVNPNDDSWHIGLSMRMDQARVPSVMRVTLIGKSTWRGKPEAVELVSGRLIQAPPMTFLRDTTALRP